jgi:hypothetical protein
MAGEYVPQTDNQQQIFDVFEEMRKLPDTSGSMLTDVYFSDVPEASSRIFRFQVRVGQASVTPESSCGVVDPCARRRFVQLLRRSRMAGCLLGELYP